jgi:hypothetical protein
MSSNKKITIAWLNETGACNKGKQWFTEQSETNGIKVVRKLMTETKPYWSNWMICRLFNRKQRIQYAAFAAEQVIDIFEKKYPDDKRPRLAIESARKCIAHDTAENRNAAAAAADAAASAAADADAAAAADAAAYAAAAYAAAAYAADAAAYADAAAAARMELQTKILNYGLELLEEK